MYTYNTLLNYEQRRLVVIFQCIFFLWLYAIRCGSWEFLFFQKRKRKVILKKNYSVKLHSPSLFQLYFRPDGVRGNKRRHFSWVLWNTESSKELSLCHPHKMASRVFFITLPPPGSFVTWSQLFNCRTVSLRITDLDHTLKGILSRFDYYGSKQLSRFFLSLLCFSILIPFWNWWKELLSILW